MMDKVLAGKKRLVLITTGVVFALVVSAAAGAGLRWLQNRGEKAPARTPAKYEAAQNLRLKGDPGGAAKTIEQSLEDPNLSSVQRYELYLEQGNVLTDQKNYVAAAEAYAKAAEVDGTFEAYRIMADTWLLAGDKQKALDGYKKALPLVPDDPMHDAETRLLEQTIKDLEAQL